MTVTVLDASQAVAEIAEIMPYLLGGIVLCLLFYIGLIVLLIRSKATPWRMLALSVAFLVSLLGVKGALDERNEWGAMNAIFVVPILIGLFTEYRLRKKQPTT